MKTIILFMIEIDKVIAQAIALIYDVFLSFV
jgi:hypothetical protein